MKRVSIFTLVLACLASLNSCIIKTVDYFSVVDRTDNVKVTNTEDAIELTRQR